MNGIYWRLSVLALTVVSVGCQGEKLAHESTASPSVVDKTTAFNPVVDQWLGRWNGPEGTYLVLSKNAEKYSVKINSLDGPATYEGVAIGDHIEFQRNGKIESIRTGSGKDTGMKWLLDEKNCLVIKMSEGFCR